MRQNRETLREGVTRATRQLLLANPEASAYKRVKLDAVECQLADAHDVSDVAAAFGAASLDKVFEITPARAHPVHGDARTKAVKLAGRGHGT